MNPERKVFDFMDEKLSGSCGESAVWSFDGSVLTVRGSGRIRNFTEVKETPFFGFREQITGIVIEEGITAVGSYAFGHLRKVSSVSLPKGLEYLGNGCFGSCDSLTSVTLPEGLRVIGPKAFEKCPALVSVSLPSTLRAVDFKAFRDSNAICEVHYAGTKRQWQRQVRVGCSSRGNASLLSAEFTYADTTRRYDEMAAKLREVLRGGDGSMYIVTPDLTVDDIDGKSGDCTLIIFPDGKTMMIDAGLPKCAVHALTLLRRLELDRLDYFTLSHPHVDHIGGAPLVEEYLLSRGGGIGTYLYSGFEHKNAEKALTELLASHGTVIKRDLRAGDRLSIGGAEVEIFNPQPEDFENVREIELGDGSVNNISLAMKFVLGNVSYLTSGDLYYSREAELVAKYGSALHADVAKTNHHSLFTSNTPEWLDAVDPRILVSDCDDAPWTEFAEELERRGIPNYRAYECGLSVVRMSPDGSVTVETEY